MGERSLNNQLNFVHESLTAYYNDKSRAEDILKVNKVWLDEVSARLSDVEGEFQRAKAERDKALIEIAHCDERIKDLDDEQRMINRKLAEIRVEKLAKEPL